ncbi:MAG: alpha/beta hydrolase [Verrucomicrobiota bacterium]
MTAPRQIFHALIALTLVMNFSSCKSLTTYQEVAEGVAKPHLMEVNGQRVFVKREGSGTPLVMLHGFAASSYSFRKLQPLLSKQFDTVAIDWNGFGYTERPKESLAYTDEGQVAMLEQVLESLGINDCVLVGHSYGAHLGLKLAEKRPDLVGRLVLVSPALEFPKPPWHLRLAPVRWAGYPAVRLLLSSPKRFQAAYRASYLDPTDFTFDVSEEYRKRLLIEGLWHAYSAMVKSVQRGAAEAVDLQQISQPIVVIAGRHDAIVPISSIEKAIQDVPAIALKVLENSGHSSPEEEPEAVAKIVREFSGG